MRTHARYELPDGTSLEDSGGGGSGHLRTDSPLSSGLVTSRSVSSESAEPHVEESTAARGREEAEMEKPRTPPSPMDTQEEGKTEAEGREQENRVLAAPT